MSPVSFTYQSTIWDCHLEAAPAAFGILGKRNAIDNRIVHGEPLVGYTAFHIDLPLFSEDCVLRS